MPDPSTPLHDCLIDQEVVQRDESQDESAYLNALRKTVDRGLEDVKAGRLVSHEDVGQEMQTWLKEEHD